VGSGQEGIVDFGEVRRDFLNHYGDFSAGILSADTVARVVGSVKECAVRWM
jgi:hypothetical protein